MERATDSDHYYRRNMNETVNAVIKQRFGAFVRSRLWWQQFRELVIKCVVHNLERSLAISHEAGDFERNGLLKTEDACSRALSTGEIDLVHIGGDSIRVVAAFEKVHNVDTYRLISFRPF